MKRLDEWVAFISQSGQELYSISQECQVLPGIIVTKNIRKLKPELKEYFEKCDVHIVTIPFNPTPKDYLDLSIRDKKLITLHGYLRIIPYIFLGSLHGKIYNGHPALINKYPELKGFNMQEQVFINKGKYPKIGSVIHEVTSVLDSGRIIATAEIDNVCQSIDQAYDLLRKTSLETWKYFFRNLETIIK